MTKKPTPEEIAELKKLPQKALRQIRALCKGNGVEADSIQIQKAGGEIVYCEAITHMELHAENTEERKKGQHQVGQVVENPAALQKEIQDLTSDAIKNDDTRKHLTKILLDRPDKGFALHAEYFTVEQLSRDFCFHEPCGTCQGQGSTNCTRCGGQKREVCPQCHGRTMTPCTFCSGSGFTQGPDGKQKQCNRCFGQRQTTCKLCQKAGSISCRQCKGSGANKCNDCGGSAFFTNITHALLKMKTLFEIDRSAIPRPVLKVIENAGGGRLIEKGHIKLLQAEQVKREDGGLAIQYDIQFPYGDLELSINGKPLKTHLFGYKGKMLKLPNFLDNIIEQNFKILMSAAMGEGNVASKIKKTSKTRLIADALLLSVSMPPKKAMLALKKKYPMGASNDLIKNAIILSNKALANVTRKTRFGGLGLGMGIAALLDSAYLLSPVRPALENIIHSPAIIVADVLLIVLGGFIANKCVVYMAKRPLKSALGALMPNTQRGKFKPKTQNNIFIGYGLSALVMMVVILVGKFTGATIPTWFPF